jgi:hypothetical protein
MIALNNTTYYNICVRWCTLVYVFINGAIKNGR